MQDLVAHLDEELSRFREQLFEYLRIPSVSTEPEHRPDVRDAARWTAERLEEAGVRARIEETPGHPVVVGEWREAGEGAPTLLVYGHYDVQPPDPVDEWTSPPFDPEVRDGRIYARGAADDKGQVFLHLKALECHLRARGTLPVNVIVLVEGEEEVGSPHLLPFIEERRDELLADMVVISDSTMFAPGLPSLLFSLRGLAYFELRVTGPERDLHSGAYGGAIRNPATALSRILATFHDDEGRVAIPGFYDDVAEWESETRRTIGDLPFDEAEFLEGVGAPVLAGEAGYTTLERLWARPTCDVNGIISGYTGKGAKTVLPARATAKVSFRLVPDQTPERVGELLRRHLERVAPPGVEVTVEQLHGGRPWRAEAEGPVFEAAARALEWAFGRRPVLTGEGGSIPIVGELERLLDAPVLLMGFALPGANMHAPDEWFPESHLRKGILALSALYEELGRGSS